MRVLLISPLPPPAGGIATWTKTYCEYCARNGHDVRVVNTAVSNRRSIDKKVHLVEEFTRTVRILVDLCRQLKGKEYDVVHINSSCSKLGLVRDLVCLRLAGKRKTVFHCHCNVADQIRNNPFAQRCLAHAVKRADKVFVLNEESYRYITKLGRDDIAVIPNFIESSTLCDTHLIRDVIKQVVYVGHVRRTKGIFEILEAAIRLPDIVFQVVGPLYEDLSEISIPDNVNLLGLKSKDEVMELLRDGDVFLFPSYTEGFSVALLEAMACGLPAIASDVGANKEMVEGCGGVIIPPRDSQAIVEAIHKIQPASVRMKMSEWNERKVRECYLVETVMNRILQVAPEN